MGSRRGGSNDTDDGRDGIHKNDMKDLKAGARRERIVDSILEQDSARVADLCREFGVTDASIRRDLSILEKEGRLRRVRGGAVAVPRDSRVRWSQGKQKWQLAEKQRIGAAAAELITPGQVLLVDSGTTTLQVVAHIPARLRVGGMLTIITNSYALVENLRSWPSPNLLFLGGIYLPDYHATVGPDALAMLRRVTADKVFLGADGLTLDEGITTVHPLMAELDRTMAERGRQVILTMDSSKLGRAGLSVITEVARIHMLITDMNAPPEIVDAIRNKGVDVRLV